MNFLLSFQTIVAVSARQDSIISLNSQLPIPDANNIYPFVFENPISHIIIDFSAVSFVDSVGCKVLKAVSLFFLFLLQLRLVFLFTVNGVLLFTYYFQDSYFRVLLRYCFL